VFEVFWEEHEHEVFSSSGALRAMLAKVEAAVVRFALVIHVARQAAAGAVPAPMVTFTSTSATTLLPYTTALATGSPSSATDTSFTNTSSIYVNAWYEVA
jgi:hypothetical protein